MSVDTNGDIKSFNPLFVKLLTSHTYDASRIMKAMRGPDRCDTCPHSNERYEQASKFKDRYVTPIRCWVYNCPPNRLMAMGMSPGDAAPTMVEGWKALLTELQKVGQGPSHHVKYHALSAVNAIIRTENRAAEEGLTRHKTDAGW